MHAACVSVLAMRRACSGREAALHPCAADSQGGSLWRGSSGIAAGPCCLPPLCIPRLVLRENQAGSTAEGHVWVEPTRLWCTSVEQEPGRQLSPGAGCVLSVAAALC